MTSTTSFTLPLRGTVRDLIQHRSWLLVACEHSEGINLGIQVLSVLDIANKTSLTQHHISTPYPIVRFVGLSSSPTTIEYQSTVIDLTLLVQVLESKLEICEQLVGVDNPHTTVKRMCTIIDLPQPTDAQQTMLQILAKAIQNDQEFAKLQQLVTSYNDDIIANVHPQVVCVDNRGQGYSLQPLQCVGISEKKSTYVPTSTLQPFSLADNIQYIEAYSVDCVLLVVEQAEKQKVLLYNIPQNHTLWQMDVPQLPPVSTSVEGEESAKISSNRRITAIATDSITGKFALGFDDGLYLVYKPQNTENGAIDFLKQELYDTEKQILVESTVHQEPIVQMIFSTSKKSEVPDYLTVAAADLSMSSIKLNERIPRRRAEKDGHSKNIRRFIMGPEYYFYSLSDDSTLRMWNTEENKSSKIGLEATCASVGLLVSEDAHGKNYFSDVLIAGHKNSPSDSANLSIRIIHSSTRNQYKSNISEDLQSGRVTQNNPFVTIDGVHAYCNKMMGESPQQRKALVEFLRTLGDKLSVNILMEFVKVEDNPALIDQGLSVLYASNHPRLPVLLTQLMNVKREATCLRVLEYLRKDNIYGRESLYPLDVANQSSFVALRQAAIRGYAELATKRREHPTEVLYQMAFSRIMDLLYDSEDDIVDVAFDLLFGQNDALLPGVDGVLTAVAHSNIRIQRLGLELLYTKNMLHDPSTKLASMDLLRQVRDSKNENLRYRAFILSLTIEEGLQQYLRQIDAQVHTQLLDLERAKKEKELAVLDRGFVLDETIVQVFLSAMSSAVSSSTEQDDEGEILQEGAQFIVASLNLTSKTPVQQLQTFSYCVQTFPMSVAVKEYLQQVRLDAENSSAKVEQLSVEEEILLQEMSLSYQASIASLGALALAKLGRVSALPILLLLVDDKDELVRSRCVDGLLEFIHEPIVEDKMRGIVLYAPNEQIKKNSKDKAVAIKEMVQRVDYRITQSMVSEIVHLIFEDGVYSHSERLAIRFLFESTKVHFSSNTRMTLFTAIREKAEQPKEINIRAKILRGLFAQARNRGEDALRDIIRLTLDSAFEDVRVLGVVRLQERINEMIKAVPNWKTEWQRFTLEEWKEMVDSQTKGGFVDTVHIVSTNASLDPYLPMVGLPKPLLPEVQILNRVFYWYGHESLQEVIKIYCAHNLIDGDIVATRRFLLSLHIEGVYQKLLSEICDNIQDTMIKGDPNTPDWHTKMWMDYLSHQQLSWAKEFYAKASKIMETPKTPEEQQLVSQNTRIPPYAPFQREAYKSIHIEIQRSALHTILQFFADAWVCPLIETSLQHQDQNMRYIAYSEDAIRILQHNERLQDTLHLMLRNRHVDVLEKGLSWMQRFTELVNTHTIDCCIERIKENFSTQSGMTSADVHRLFVKPEIFALIPKPTLFGREQEMEYFTLLSSIFVYQTSEMLVEAVGAYEAEKQRLTENIQQQEKEIHQLSVEKAQLDSDNQDTSALQEKRTELQATLQMLRQEVRQLRKPEPVQDSRFLDVFRLCVIAKGAWVNAMLEEYMNSFDDRLSDEAFNIYFARGIRDNSQGFLQSLIRNDHPRLDDVFAMLLSQKYGDVVSMQHVFVACTRLARIDIAFESFTQLAANHLLTEDVWKNLLQSKHTYLRYRAIQYFVQYPNPNAKIQPSISREEMLASIYKSFCAEEIPHAQSSILTERDLQVGIIQNTQQEIHAFLKNGKTLTFSKMQRLREHVKISPSFMRKLMQSDMHCLASGLTWEQARDLQEMGNQHGMTIVLYTSNPLFATVTYTLWESIITQVLGYIHQECWEEDDDLCAQLCLLDQSFQQQSRLHQYRQAVMQAIGSIVSTEKQAYLEQLLAKNDAPHTALHKTIAISLARSGNIKGLQYLYEQECPEFFPGIMALGPEAEMFLSRALLGEKDAEFQIGAIQLWLLQKAMYGGNANMMMSMLNATEPVQLLSAQLFATLYDKELFIDKAIQVLKLHKVALSTYLSALSFQKIDMWRDSMQHIKTVYKNHYRVSPEESFSPSLQDYLSVEKRFAEVSTLLAKDDKNKTAKTELEKVIAQQKKINAVRHITVDEWKWLSKRLSGSNTRIRYMVGQFMREKVLSGAANRVDMLKTMETIRSLEQRYQVSFVEFQPFVLNGTTITKASAVSFGFGTLAGLIRNHQQTKVFTRRTALASVIQLGVQEDIPTISALISTALNDPTQTMREETFALALVHQRDFHLTWDGIINQTINSVAFRNTQAGVQGENQYDSLNHLLVSEVYAANRIDVLLHSIEKHTHHLALVSLEFLLHDSLAGVYEITALQKAVLSPNTVLQRRLVNLIIQRIEAAQQHNAKQDALAKEQAAQNIPVQVAYIDEQPFWDVLASCLKHGVQSVRNNAAEYLISHNKHVVVPFVYREWLDSYASADQHKACAAIEKLRPEGASAMVLQRIVKDPTETASVGRLGQTLLVLNDYSPEVADMLVSEISTLATGSQKSKVLYRLLLSFTGITLDAVKATENVYRIDLFCTVLQTLIQNSLYTQIKENLRCLLQHPIMVSARLDGLLLQLAQMSVHQLEVREQALLVCIQRYMEMTPRLANFTPEEQQKTPVLDAKWDGSDWTALRNALDANLDFHPIESKRKEYLSVFQKHSAKALLSCQGYPYLAFSVLRKLLLDAQYQLQERVEALDVLTVTQSVQLQPTVLKLSGLDTQGKSVPEQALFRGVPVPLYHKAIAMSGYYHYTDKGSDIFHHVLGLFANPERRPYALQALWSFKDYTQWHDAFLETLLNCSMSSSTSWKSYSMSVSNMPADSKGLHVWFELVMHLYDSLFSVAIPPAKHELAKKAQDTIVSMLYVIDVNRVYKFYTQHCAKEDIALDLTLYTHPQSILLHTASRQVLVSRLAKHVSENGWIQLLQKCIELHIEQQKSEKIVHKAILDSRDNQAQRLATDAKAVSGLTVADIEPLWRCVDVNSLPMLSSFFAGIASIQTDMVADARTHLRSLFHQQQFGEFVLCTEDTLQKIVPFYWQNIVDAWEVHISSVVSRIDFYYKLLEKEIHRDGPFLQSIVDMVQHKKLGEGDLRKLFAILTNARKEWVSLQQDKAKGLKNDQKIQEVEVYWGSALRLVELLDIEDDELRFILTQTQYYMPMHLVEKALDIYLVLHKNDVDQDVLGQVFAKYPVLRTKVLSYFTLSMLIDVTVTFAANLSDFRMVWPILIQEISRGLQPDRIDIPQIQTMKEQGWLHPGTNDINEFLSLVEKQDIEGLRSFVATEKTQMLQFHILENVVGKILGTATHLVVNYLGLHNDGKTLANVYTTYTNNSQQAPFATVDMQWIHYVLSGVVDLAIAEKYKQVSYSQYAHRKYVTQLESARSSRFCKEQ